MKQRSWEGSCWRGELAGWKLRTLLGGFLAVALAVALQRFEPLSAVIRAVIGLLAFPVVWAVAAVVTLARQRNAALARIEELEMDDIGRAIARMDREPVLVRGPDGAYYRTTLAWAFFELHKDPIPTFGRKGRISESKLVDRFAVEKDGSSWAAPVLAIQRRKGFVRLLHRLGLIEEVVMSSATTALWRVTAKGQEAWERIESRGHPFQAENRVLEDALEAD